MAARPGPRAAKGGDAPASLIPAGAMAILTGGAARRHEPSLRNRSTKLGKFPLLALLALAACGGAPIRPGSPSARTRRRRWPRSPRPARPGPRCSSPATWPGARAAYEAELAGDPDQLAALNDLAVGYFLDGHVDAARRLLDEVVANGSPREQQAALLNLGALYAVEGHATAAQAYLETARGLDLARPEPHYALALLADARGEPARRARAALREALRLDDGTARAAFAFPFREGRLHLDALLAEQSGDDRRGRRRVARAGPGAVPGAGRRGRSATCSSRRAGRGRCRARAASWTGGNGRSCGRWSRTTSRPASRSPPGRCSPATSSTPRPPPSAAS